MLGAYGLAAYWLLLPSIDVPLSTPIEAISPTECADADFTQRLSAQRVILFTPLAEIPESVVEALLLEEDAFYHHHGVDWIRVTRAAIRNVQSGRIEFGASTLTMQLMRELFLEKRRTFPRKVREIAYALQAERRLSKSEILELYLNVVHWGPGIRGIGLAACFYFGIPPQNLDAAQAMALVQLLPNPEVRGMRLRVPAGK